MIAVISIVSITIVSILLINRAFSKKTKSCEFCVDINIKGFKIEFKINEKNAPSDK